VGDSPRSELASWSQLTRGLALASGLAVLLCAAWLWQRRLVPSIDEGYPSRLTPTNLLDSTDRAMEVAGGFLASWSRVLRWHLLWPLFFATLIWALGRPRALSRHPALPGVLVVLGACLMYFAILLVTPWELERLFQTVIPGRLLLHVAPITVFAALSLAWCRPEERT